MNLDRGSGARPGRTSNVPIAAFTERAITRTYDDIVTEEPLEIRLVAGATTQTLAITMRTPGHDFELAAGFVCTEGIVGARDDIAGISYCVDPAIDAEQRYNIVNIELRTAHLPNLDRFERHFTMNSSCGICGRANLDALRDRGVSPIEDDVTIPVDLLYELPAKMRDAQRIFSATGGLHATALFTSGGELMTLREDVGRHNALDKAIGWAFLNNRLPLAGTIAFVSGRSSYEIVQKCAVARIAIVAAVSAPSNLAVDVAREFGITLAGFVRDHRCNVYSREDRIRA